MKEYRLFKKIIAVLCLCLLLTSCADTTTVLHPGDTTTDPQSVLSMPYCKKDSMNPFLSTGKENRILWPLLFLSLFETDNEFKPQPLMVDTYEITPTSISMTLRSELRTPEGTELSIADVLYSFRLAQQSPQYASSLSVFAEAKIGSTANVLVFTLNKPNVNACSLLTFPVVQYGTADTESSVPIGAGPYSLSKLNDGYCMIANPYYFDGQPQSGQINLLDAGDESAQSFALECGTIDCRFTDIADGEIFRSAASARRIDLLNLVFLGINFKNENLQKQTVRQALSAALDRAQITEHAFCSYALPATTPFHPAWADLQNITNHSRDHADVQLATAFLSAASLQEGDDASAANAQTQNYTLRLLYCPDNPFKAAAAKQIKEQIEETPIRVALVAKTAEEYKQAIENDDYDLFLGEVLLTNDMDLSAFLFAGGTMAYGIDFEKITCDETYTQYLNGAAELSAFITDFTDQMPFIPVCTREGVFYTSRSLKNEVICTPQNLFKNIFFWEK